MRLFTLTLIFSIIAACNNPEPTTEQTPAPPSAARPSEPAPAFDYDTAQWVEISAIDSTIRLDIRYASTSNFTGKQIYDCGRCFLRKAAAQRLLAIQRELRQRGLGVLLFDCYRPRPYQWRLWEAVPNPDYVADPRQGSMHNRGVAVDLTLVDSTGQALPMGTDYDFFGPEAHHDYTRLPDSILANRHLLRQTMERHGFEHIRTEWWHYSLTNSGAPLDDWVWKCPTH